MRRIIWLGLIVATLWCGWWMIASFGMERAVSNGIAAGRAEGLKIEVQDVASAGFPLSLHTRLRGIALNDPQTGLGISATHLDIKAAAYWPGHLRIDFPETPIQLSTPDANLTLKMSGAATKLRLHPGSALEVQKLTSDVAKWTIAGLGGELLSADTWHLSAVQSDVQREIYAVSFSSKNLIPGDIVRTVLELPPSWPLAFETFTAEVIAKFDRPWDRSALSQRPPQPRALTVRKTELIWGPLTASITGDLTIHADGTPTGVVSFRANNWRTALEGGKDTFAQGVDPQAQAILNLLTNPSTQPDTIDLKITFEGGQMRFGFIPLGTAPKIIFR